VRTLVAGWFSFEQMGATAGDLMTRDLARRVLEEAGHHVDIAVAAPFTGGVDWSTVNPADYQQVVFVCGPCGNGWPLTEFVERFRHTRLVGLNLTMLEPLEVWNPFDLLLERDSSRTSRAELAFICDQPKTPVVGVILVHAQLEYKAGLHDSAHQMIHRVLRARDVAAVSIDTRLDLNANGLYSPGQVESLIARMDTVVTTRLHGTVLALKNGVPALVVDPIAGGAKIRRQCETIGWPLVFNADALDQAEFERAFDYSLTEAARVQARECAQRARTMAGEVRDAFLADAMNRNSGC
jgi:hypothetical protein